MDAQRYSEEMKRFLADKAANEFAVARSNPRKSTGKFSHVPADSQPEYQHSTYNHIAHMASIPNVHVYTVDGEYQLNADDIRAQLRRENNGRLRVANAALEEEIEMLRKDILLHGREVCVLSRDSSGSHTATCVRSRSCSNNLTFRRSSIHERTRCEPPALFL
jgi:hypothetical protein